MLRLRQLIALLVGISLFGMWTPAHAAYHALLIGASTFPNAPGISTLEGPVNDVESLKTELTTNWKVPAQNIVILLNETATRRQILSELSALADRAVKGDTVFLYYSGHGTSAHDRNSNLRLDLSTGAIVPSDIRQSGDPKALVDQLIVGVRDIRPNLSKMDQKGVKVLVLFDACYSGDSAKSIGELVPRNADFLIDSIIVAPEKLTSFNQAIANADKAPPDWPYENVVYFSASARNEVAYDISNRAARNDRPTIDGKAHGAFTNAFLKALHGAADTNHDGKMSYAEMHGYLVRQLQHDGQTPQLHPQNTLSVQDSVFVLATSATTPAPGPNTAAAASASRPPATPAAADPGVSTVNPILPAKPEPLRVRMEGREQGLEARLAELRGVQVVTGNYDLEIMGRAPRFRLMHSGGSLVTPNVLNEEDLLRIIRQQATAHQLVNIPFGAQDFNLALFMNPDQGAYHLGERLRISVRSERDAWLLAFNVDVEGNVYLVSPARPGDAQKIQAGQTVPLIEVEASEPTGTEIVHVFAFSEKPSLYDELPRSVRLAESQVRNLTDTLARDAARPGRSQAQRITYTTKN